MRNTAFGTILRAWVPIVLLTAAAAGHSMGRVKPSGETVLARVQGGLNVQVTFKTHEVPLSPGFRRDPYDQSTSCTASRRPCSLVDSIQIAVNGKRVFVSRSAFSDLSDISRASIQVGNKILNLIIDGGDGAESYIVRLEFNKNSVTRRTLASGLEPNRPVQVTRYYWLPALD